MGVRACPQADLAPLALGHRVLVLVQDGHVPPGHGLAHRPLAHLHEGEVPAQRVALGETVEVEHGDPVLIPEPANGLGVQGLARRAHDPEPLGIPGSGVGDRHHRTDGGGSGEHVRHPMAGQEVQLPAGIEARLALVDALHCPQAPGPEQGRDASRPCPLAHAVEALALLDVVAVDELVVGEQVSVGVDYPLGQPGGARRVVQLGGIVGGRVGGLELGGGARERGVVQHE